MKVRKGRRAFIHDITFENVIALVEGDIAPQTVIDVKEPAVIGKITMKNVSAHRIDISKK